MQDEPGVVTMRDGRIGRVRLNRPRTLNVLDLGMVRAITSALLAWKDDPTVHAVVIEGAGERAFCAGGDVRALRQAHLDGRPQDAEAFFSEEYALNLIISTYPKPHVALIDGICMGGGIGVSVHGTFRIATERAQFAMPETAIGFFPDIGATFILPRLPGELGTYLGLTGARVAGADSVHAGFATHFVPRARLAALSADLARDGVAALAAYAETLPPFALAPHRALIDGAFAADTVPEILARLETDGGAFARETIVALRTVSPSALVATLRLLRKGAQHALADTLHTELRATRTLAAAHDFLEGVRAMVVDKDRTPSWRPSRIEDVR